MPRGRPGQGDRERNPDVQEDSKRQGLTHVQVTAWDREPGTVLEVAIAQRLSVESMEKLTQLTASSIRMLLKLALVVGE